MRFKSGIMLCRRTDQEKNEAKSLAAFAQSSGQNRGRCHEEDPHPVRSQFQRDRDRIIHSRAFRRLEYKSQVFLNSAGDHYRTRLTHTMEVAAISRSIARSLRLNEDLAEAIALGHDLGHPPFGHPGETTLNALMQDHGGFEHNRQSVRVVEELELKYPAFNGLNLSWEVREGLSKHCLNTGFAQPSLEAQAADVADEIAYCCHDLDDGLESGLITEEQLRQLQLWRQVEEPALKEFPRLDSDRRRNYVLRCLLNRFVEDVLEESDRRLHEARPGHPDDARKHPKPLIGFSAGFHEIKGDLRRFLYLEFYHHPSIQRANDRACVCLRQLFELLVGHPHLLGQQFGIRVKKDGLHRATCDYLACMTDRYALEQHRKLIGGRSALDETVLKQSALL
jgi:dGTPase